MKVKDLIEKLQEINPHWEVSSTGSTGSIFIYEDEKQMKGKRYGYVFIDDRPTKILTHKS